MSDEPTVQEPPKRKKNMDRFLVVLTCVLVSGFMALIFLLFVWNVPEGNKDILVYMAGQLSGFTAAAVALWTNTTYHSNQKTELIAKANPVEVH